MLIVFVVHLLLPSFEPFFLILFVFVKLILHQLLLYLELLLSIFQELISSHLNRLDLFLFHIPLNLDLFLQLLPFLHHFLILFRFLFNDLFNLLFLYHTLLFLVLLNLFHFLLVVQLLC